MGLAFVRQIALGLGAVLCLSIALFSLRWMGLQQTPLVFEHPALSQPPKIIAKSLEVYRQSRGELPGLWARVDLEEAEKKVWRSRETGQDLKSLFTEYPKTSFLFEFDTDSPNSATALLEQLRANKADGYFYLNSHNEGLLGEIKKQEPRWIYGAGLRQIMKARLYSALFLEPLADIRADFVVYSPQDLAKKGLTPRLAKEIRRRKIQLIAESDEISDLKKHKVLRHASGILTARPTREMHDFLQAKAKVSP